MRLLEVYRSTQPGLSFDGLTDEQRRVLLELGLLRVYRIPVAQSREQVGESYVDVCDDCTLHFEPPDLGIAYVPPPAHDPELSYAASKGLTLFPFQEVGVGAMVALTRESRRRSTDGRGGVLVFDEMGLGKTMEAIAYVARLRPAPRRVLVICPNTLKQEWKKAIETWLEVKCGRCEGAEAGEACEHCNGGGIRTAVFATTRGGLRRFKGLPDTPGWTTAPMRWLITNYETMRSEDYLDILQAFNPDVLLFDEAHRLRNWERKTARVSRTLTADTEVFMTGTPVVNHAGDLWSMISRVAPGSAGSAYDFEYQYTYSRRGAFGAKKFGVRNAGQLRSLLAQVAIQRKKVEVLKELPPKIYREVPLELNNGQKELYEQMERQLFIMLDSGLPLQADSVLAQMTRLRQLCCDPRILGVGHGAYRTGAELGLPEDLSYEQFKVGEIVGVKTEFLLELLEDLGSEQIVVFSNFEQYISLIEASVKMTGMSYARLTGKEVGDARSENIARFQKGEVQVLLGTTQAGGEGVNLQAASRVVLLDRWWSPVRNEQAIDRLHRIGQVASVQAILPHCVETIDDALKEILHRKYTVINELRVQGDTIALLKKWRNR